ncbi:MAG: TIGR00730 family Rossman fold protein [Rhodospirillales bacterium]|nr:TIGR00730 family Rossman fold protein [Rhodospirillales bacterium]
MTSVMSVCVFCGSRTGNDSRYAEAARALGHEIASRGMRLVFGAGSIGLMGIVADAAAQAGGEVVGIIPEFLQRLEVGRTESDQFIVTDSMHSRKQRMFEMSDAFISLPGGLGTLDETFEIITWRQLKLHDKPIVVWDVAGYWKPFRALVDATIENGFSAPENRDLFTLAESLEDVFAALAVEPLQTAATDTSRL